MTMLHVTVTCQDITMSHHMISVGKVVHRPVVVV